LVSRAPPGHRTANDAESNSYHGVFVQLPARSHAEADSQWSFCVSVTSAEASVAESIVKGMEVAFQLRSRFVSTKLAGSTPEPASSSAIRTCSTPPVAAKTLGGSGRPTSVNVGAIVSMSTCDVAVATIPLGSVASAEMSAGPSGG